MKYRLGELVEIVMGQSPKSEFYNKDGLGIPFLQGNRTFGDKYPEFDTYTTFITKEGRPGDVIMSVRAPVGDLNMIEDRVCLGRGVCALRMKNGNQDFLFYLMKYYREHLVNRENGTTFGSVNKKDIEGLIIDLPDIDRQNYIAKILSDLDKKIELLKHINKNLDALILLITCIIFLILQINLEATLFLFFVIVYYFFYFPQLIQNMKILVY